MTVLAPGQEIAFNSLRKQIVYITFSERTHMLYLHELTNNEREISIPHEAAGCGIENFEFMVSERVRVNPDNSRAMSALRATASKYGESHDSSDNSDFFLLRQKDPFGELFS